MAQQFSRTDQRRITFLSLLSSAATWDGAADDPYSAAHGWLANMESDGFFDEAGSTRPTREASPGRSGTSRPQGSSSRPSNRGRDQQRTPFTGQMRDPDGPPTEKQVGLVLKNTDDYTEDELFDMTKQQVSDLIQDLIG